MPQLNPDTFLTQAVWLVVTFVLLYLVIWRLALPRISAVLSARQERIAGDLEKAEALKAQAEEILAAYEKAISQGRAEAQALLREAADKLAAESEARNAELTTELARQAEAAEQRIAEVKRQAIGEMRGVASEVAQASVAKLIGADVPLNEAEAAVGKIVEERH